MTRRKQTYSSKFAFTRRVALHHYCWASCGLLLGRIACMECKDAACCCRCSVSCVSVCLLVTTVSPTKTAEPIEVPFAIWTQLGPGSHVLGGLPGSSTGKGNYFGGPWRCGHYWFIYIIYYINFLISPVTVLFYFSSTAELRVCQLLY